MLQYSGTLCARWQLSLMAACMASCMLTHLEREELAVPPNDLIALIIVPSNIYHKHLQIEKMRKQYHHQTISHALVALAVLIVHNVQYYEHCNVRHCKLEFFHVYCNCMIAHTHTHTCTYTRTHCVSTRYLYAHTHSDIQ